MNIATRRAAASAALLLLLASGASAAPRKPKKKAAAKPAPAAAKAARPAKAAKAPGKTAKRAAKAPKVARAKTPPPAPVVPLHPPRVSTQAIAFVWPPAGLVLSADHEFVLGSVAVATAPFAIDGQTVTVHKDGGFLAFLPVAEGTFTFHAELKLGATTAVADLPIFVPPPPAPLPSDRLAIDPASLSPRADLELRAGDWWTVRMRATPHRRARFRVGSGPWRELRESARAPGSYETSLQVRPGEEFGPAPVEYEIGSGWSSERAKGPASVAATARTPAIATVRGNGGGFAAVKIGPNEGFLAFPPSGVRFPATGRDGSEVRVEFAPGVEGWIETKDVDLSTGAAPPRATSDNIGLTVDADKAVVRVPLSDKVPFTVDEDEAGGLVTLRLYRTHSHTNWINYEGLDEFVREVSWRQEASEIMTVDVRLRPGERLWGWHADYEGGSLRLTLRRAPVIDPRRPLAGLRIMLDPGHTSAPTDGATGPLGTREPVANYAIAQAVAARLQKEGATALISRASLADDVPLAERPRLAVERKADLFVSLHNNALPDGADPFAKPHGFMVFYYHPHSLDLGRAVHAAYAKDLSLPDEGLKWGNLLVARLTDVPAILVENVMMIFPDQEALLNDPAFRDRLAKDVVAGLRGFALEAGRRRKK